MEKADQMALKLKQEQLAREAEEALKRQMESLEAHRRKEKEYAAAKKNQTLASLDATLKGMESWTLTSVGAIGFRSKQDTQGRRANIEINCEVRTVSLSLINSDSGATEQRFYLNFNFTGKNPPPRIEEQALLKLLCQDDFVRAALPVYGLVYDPTQTGEM